MRKIKSEKGLLSLEACIAVTIFIFMMLFLYSFFVVFEVRNEMGHVTLATANCLSLDEYENDALGSSNTIGQIFYNVYGQATNSQNDFTDFRKWYEFRPERFIFEQASYLYFIVDSDKYKQRGVVTIENEDIDNGSLLCLMPKTFLDYCLYGIFINYKYKIFKRKVEITKTSENNKERARGMFILLNSLQSEVEKELKDSNKIIEEEIEKMRGV